MTTRLVVENRSGSQNGNTNHSPTKLDSQYAYMSNICQMYVTVSSEHLTLPTAHSDGIFRGTCWHHAPGGTDGGADANLGISNARGGGTELLTQVKRGYTGRKRIIWYGPDRRCVLPPGCGVYNRDSITIP